jgi:hypothetical protein
LDGFKVFRNSLHWAQQGRNAGQSGSHASPGSIKLTPLVGRIRLSRGEHFEIG